MLKRLVGHLHLKRIALRSDRAQVQRTQHRCTITAIASSSILDRQTKHEPGVNIAAAADKTPQQRPVRRTTTSYIARPNDQIGMLCRSKKIWQIARVVREIRIHFES